MSGYSKRKPGSNPEFPFFAFDINGPYTTHTNRKRKRSGHLFQGRYKAILIDRDGYLLELSRYVHLNPVRAKIVSRPEDYPYSSYASYISRKKDDCVYHELILGMISKEIRVSRKKYRAFVEIGLKEKLENPMKDVYGAAILGSKTFIRESLGRLKWDPSQRGDCTQKAASGRARIRGHHRHHVFSFENLPVGSSAKRWGKQKDCDLIDEEADRYEQQTNRTSIWRTQLLCCGEGVSKVLSGVENEQAAEENSQRT